MLDPLELESQVVGVAGCWCWEPTVGLLEGQASSLNLEPSLQPLIMSTVSIVSIAQPQVDSRWVL